MSTKTAFLKTEILSDLERLSKDELTEIRAHVAALVKAVGQRSSKRESLAGIWEGCGFEQIPDLEGDLRQTRKALGDAIVRL